MSQVSPHLDGRGRPGARTVRRPRAGADRSQLPAFLPELVVCAVVVPTVWLGPALALQVTGLVVCAWTAHVVLRRGGDFLVPSAVFALAAGVFLGIACLYLSVVGPEVVSMSTLRDVAVLAVVIVVLGDLIRTLLTTARRTSWPTRDEMRGVSLPPKLFEIKALAMVGLAMLPLVNALSDAVAIGLGFGGSLMFALSASTVRRRVRWAGELALVAMAFAVPMVWALTYFTGGGRLLLAGLGIAVVSAWNLARARRSHKVAVLLSIPLILAISAVMRVEMHASDDRRTVKESGPGAGLESVYVPVDTFAEVLTTDPVSGKQVGPRWGATFVNTALMPVPRSWWEDKPKGFGAELTEVYRPGLVRDAHSMAGLLHSEAYANFGWTGLVGLPLVLGWVLAGLDCWHSRLAWSGLHNATEWWSAAILLCIVGSLGDLLWVGTFTFYVRGGFAALLVALIGRMSVTRSRRLSSAHPNSPPVPARELASSGRSA